MRLKVNTPVFARLLLATAGQASAQSGSGAANSPAQPGSLTKVLCFVAILVA